MTTKITANVIASGAISTASLADTSITAAKLAGTLDLTGKTVTVATATAGDNDTTVASTAFVTTAIANLTDSAPAALDTLNELAAALNDDANFSTTVTNSIATKLPLAGGTLTGDLNFGDSDKAIFGTDSDLEIYHNGSASFISDVGTGDLFVRASNSLKLQSADVENYLVANANGAVTLYYNNAAKLATTNTGIDVTGTVTMDGLTVDGSSQTTSLLVNTSSTAWADSNADDLIIRGADVGITISSSTTGGINFGDSTSATKQGQITYTHSGDNLDFYTSANKRLGIAGNGDISFYEDTGTTAKLFWDASAESLTLGNGGSEGTLNVGGSTSSIVARFTDATTSSVVVRPESGGAIIGTDGGGTLHLASNGSTLSDRKMTILTTGNVGIGTTSPSYKLSVSGNIGLTDGVSTATHALVGGNYYIQNTGAYSTIFQTTGSERMRLDASGNLLVGTTSTSPWTAATNSSADNGIALRSDGIFAASASKSTANSGNVAILNRTGTDGSILSFYKSGATVGSIGTSGGSTYIGGYQNAGLYFNGTTDIRPWNTSTQTKLDNSVNLGSSLARFKDLYLSNAIYLGSGTGTTTSYISDFEDDLYIYNKESAGKLFLGTNNSTKVTIDSLGKVGIGTTFPNAKLQIGSNSTTPGTGGDDFLIATSGSTGMSIESGNTDVGQIIFNDTDGANRGRFFYDHDGDYLRVDVNGSERLRIDSSGKVGVGTTTPAAPLDVISNSSAIGIDLRGRSSDNIGQLSFESNDSATTYSQIQSRSTELLVKTIANIPMSFYTNNTERMSIASDGSALFRPSTSSDDFGFEVRTGNSADTGMKIGRTGTNNAQMGIVVSSNGTSSYANLIMKISDTLAFNSAANISLRNNGLVRIQSAFSNDTYATHRAVYAEDQGELGYAASVRASKTNIQDLSDVSWLLNLEPKTFNKRLKNEDGSYSETEHSNILEVGLIAEDVESENNILCFYDVNRTTDDDGNETVTQTNLAGIRYEMLAVPLLKLVQEQQTIIESLEARITALES